MTNEITTMDDLSSLLGLANPDVAATLVEGGSEALFPYFRQSAKERNFTAADKSDASKPLDGANAITGIYLSHRLTGVGFPKGFDTKAGKDNQPDPVFRIAVGATSAEDWGLLKNAAAAVQFTAAGNRAVFDFNTPGDPAHVKVSMEILIYNHVLDSVIVLQSYNHYNAVFGQGQNTSAALAKLRRDGRINAVPIVFSGQSKPGYNSPDLNFIGADIRDTEENQQCKEGFEQFIAGMQQDPELIARVTEWCKGEDMPLNGTIRESLAATVALNPPKY